MDQKFLDADRQIFEPIDFLPGSLWSPLAQPVPSGSAQSKNLSGDPPQIAQGCLSHSRPGWSAPNAAFTTSLAMLRPFSELVNITNPDL
jgi:hypothetical protein